MKKFYGILCILGIVLPYWQFISWIAENGITMNAFLSEAISSRVSAFAWLDVMVAAIVLIGFVIYEGSRLEMKRLWLPILGTCTVGVSLGLPLFLLLREIHLAKQHHP